MTLLFWGQVKAQAVQTIYSRYENGESYLAIAKYMNENVFPKYSDQKAWSKNHIKRILENERYTGANGFPSIISTELFGRVRALLHDKTNGWQKRKQDEFQPLWDKTVCKECGGRMLRTGSPQARNGRHHARCDNPACGNRITVDGEALRGALLALQREYVQALADVSTDNIYHLTADILKVNNKINSRLAKPSYEEANEIIDLIMQGASARYESIMSPLDTALPEAAADVISTPDKINWTFIGTVISEIRLEPHTAEFITIQGKMASYQL